MGLLVAGIDIGTLTCRLLIARIHGAKDVTQLESDRRILRLGEGVDRERRLSHEAMTRVINTLREWRTRIVDHGVARTAVVATSAVREAGNREKFLDWVKRDVGFEVEVLDGEEEARRTLLGIRCGLPHEVSHILGLDIGGGSTEFIVARENQPPVVCSIDLGVVRLTERVLASDAPTEEEISAAECLIDTEVDNIRPTLGDLTGLTLVGTAGTVTTLAAMAQRLPMYEPARIHNFWLDLRTVCDLERELRKRTRLQRRHLLGLEPGREEVIVAGTVILRRIMETLGFDRCLVSDYGLREGILVEFARRLKD